MSFERTFLIEGDILKTENGRRITWVAPLTRRAHVMCLPSSVPYALRVFAYNSASPCSLNDLIPAINVSTNRRKVTSKSSGMPKPP